MTPTPPDRSVEEIAKQLHGWYLEATKELNPENYNAKAQVAYDDMNEEQKEIDRYIARKVLSLHHQGFEAGRRETEKAFGGCPKCYGKGYATVKENYTHHADFIGDKTYTTPAPIMRFCSCERGKALATLKHPNEPV